MKIVSTRYGFMGTLLDVITTDSEYLLNAHFGEIASGTVVDVGQCRGRFQAITVGGETFYVDPKAVKFEDP